MRKALLGPVLLAALGCAACSDETVPGDISEGDQPDTATTQLQAIGFPVIERYGLYGASCAYAPGTSIGAVVVARQDDAFILIDGEAVQLEADLASQELPYGSHSQYTSPDYTLQLELADDGEQSAIESMRYEGTVRLINQSGVTVYESDASAQCGV